MLCPRSCFSVVWLTCLGPQGTGLERKCKLLWWFPVKYHMKSGTPSTDSCRADPGAHEFPHPSSLSCVYHFLLNQSLLIAWIIQLLVGACLPCVRQRGCSLLPALWWGGCSRPGVAPGAAGTVLVLQVSPCSGHLWWIQNTNHLRNPEFGDRNHFSVKEVKNSWFILCSSSERNVSDSNKFWVFFFLRDVHRAYNNGTI